MTIPADYEWPTEAHGVPIPRDPHGYPRLFTEGEGVVHGVTQYRRMTPEEVYRWIESKTGETKVRPAKVQGTIP